MRADRGFKCERCGSPEGPEPGHSLTVNRVTTTRGYMVMANLVVLCRHCQGRTRAMRADHLVKQLELFEPFERHWLVPHLERLGIPLPDLRIRNQ